MLLLNAKKQIELAEKLRTLDIRKGIKEDEQVRDR